ncbi:FAD binding domain protein [Colletotrichum musicola]|uniref:FAD binding domain protein n=1 Tax=Colletotrichum musicola TaxID=2175873 RepID=A0A8H6JN04_9PEZI|nr:FAD binding domain protein [Colletotrichum musicola]
MARMQILISGAGIAGNSLAFWLSKLGHDVTVIERFPALRTTGLQLDLRGHGVEVMKRMGLEQAFRARAAPEQGLEFVDSQGRRSAYFPAIAGGQGLQSFTSDFEIMRGDLCRLLRDAAGDNVKFVFGTSIESLEQLADGGVDVRFADGRRDYFDLLVGADGQGSRTRRMLLGADETDKFEPLGSFYACYFTVRKPMAEGEGYEATVYVGTDNRTIMMRRHTPDDAQIYLIFKNDSEEFRRLRRNGCIAEQKEGVAEVFRGNGWRTDEILKGMMESSDFYWEQIGLVKMDPWSRGGSATLLGDAGYCPSPMTGMGTTSAVVGAYVLAGEIGRHCGGDAGREGLGKALAAYEETFRPFVNQVQFGISADSLMWKMWPTGRFGIAVMNSLLGWASFFKLNVLGEYVLKEDVKGWELPKYEELLRS